MTQRLRARHAAGARSRAPRSQEVRRQRGPDRRDRASPPCARIASHRLSRVRTLRAAGLVQVDTKLDAAHLRGSHRRSGHSASPPRFSPPPRDREGEVVLHGTPESWTAVLVVCRRVPRAVRPPGVGRACVHTRLRRVRRSKQFVKVRRLVLRWDEKDLPAVCFLRPAALSRLGLPRPRTSRPRRDSERASYRTTWMPRTSALSGRPGRVLGRVARGCENAWWVASGGQGCM